MPHKQEGRLISISTPLATDKLLLAGFTGHEAISRLFSFHVDLLAEPEPNDPPIDFKQIVGQKVTLSVVQSDDSPRYFNGIVSQFAMTGIEGTYTRYQMQVVPRLWTLTRYADCRIFHNKDVKEVIEAVFSSREFSEYEFALNASYPKMEYCVQYRETDFNFISRLMEKFGLFYYFEHADESHTMKILDSSASILECPSQESAEFNLATGGLDDADVVNEWSLDWEWKSGKITHVDYNFKTPSANLLASESTVYLVGSNGGFELFDYPGEYTLRADGKNLTKVRMEEEEAGHLVGHGSSVCRAFSAGYKFGMTGHPQSSYNASYILTEIQHLASSASGYGLGKEGHDSYSNHFSCIPANVNYRPARLTPKPFVQGPQTAVVVGKASDQDSADDDNAGGDGEEIWVDKYGRVMVKFFWDRESACSCWVRVSQDWAGQGWGMINIPRVGQEVIVSFLEGDPDRPIITGRVYNDTQTVPYKLPDHGTRTTLKTRSTPGGGDNNYNEIRFEDKKGREDLLIHAERTMHNSVEASQYITVGGSRHITTGGVDKDGNKLGDVKELVFKNHNLHVQGDDKIKIEGASHAHVMDQADAIYDKDLVLSVNKKCVILADTIQLQGTTKIVLMAGSSSLVIDASGVTVLGTPMINLNTPGAPPTPEIIPLSVDPEDP